MNDVSKLGRLLDLRRHDEQKRTIELALANKAVSDSEAALEALARQRGELEAAVAQSNDSVGQLKTLRLLLDQVDVSVRNANSVRALALATVDEKIEALKEASRYREALERVVGPREEQMRVLQRLAERKEEDESALVPFRIPKNGSR